MKKVLITGMGGFVGQYVAENLQNEGKYQIYGTKLEHHLSIENPNINLYNVRLQNADEVNDVIEKIKPDYIYHLAAQSSPKKSLEQPVATVEANIIGTINLLEAVKKTVPDCRILLTGSSEEYGSTFKTIAAPKEDSKCSPESNIYGITKVAQNSIGMVYTKVLNMNIIMARSFNHCGPGQSSQFVVGRYCDQVAKIEKGLQEPIMKVGNLNSARDFCDVRDIVNAYRMLVECGRVGETYNVGRGISIKIGYLLKKIINKSTKEIDVIVDKGLLNSNEIPETVADIRKIKNELGWEPKISIDKTIDDTLEYCRQKIK